MTNKLPWATAAVIIVVAAIGAWTIFGAAPAAPPTAGTAGVSATLGPTTVFGAPPENSGIENIYIVDNTHAEGFDINFSGNENVLGTISVSGDPVNIAYDTRFAIVVAVTGHTDDMGQLNKDYMQLALGAYTSSGDWSITWENSAPENEYIFRADNTTTIRFNVVWDNAGSGYELTADDNLEIENVDLWLRGPIP